jgi:tripartite-type tricarboxylate transporter receptor subunit TctC
MAFVGVSSSIAQIKTGKLKALAISTTERLASLSEVPTLANNGVPGYESGA